MLGEGVALSPPLEGGGSEPALECLNRGVGVKMWRTTELAFQCAHPHPSLPPVRGKGLPHPLPVKGEGMSLPRT